MVQTTPVQAGARVALFDPEQGLVVRRPETDAPGHWAGAPAVYRDPATGEFYLTYRRRRARGDHPDRGYAGFIARSSDGVEFDDIWSIEKQQLDSPSMERFCLRRSGGQWLLYISYVDPADNRWRIDVLTADSPDGFDPAGRRPVLTAAGTGTEGVKDPYVTHLGPAWIMFASYAAAGPFTPEQRAAAHGSADIYTTGATTFPTGVATSLDGLEFDWHGQALPIGESWDRYQSRISGLLATGAGWLAFYDGSADQYGNYEERCGLALSFDLTRWLRLTAREPALVSPYATGSLRYVDAVSSGETTHFYYEYAREDGAHELRVVTTPA